MLIGCLWRRFEWLLRTMIAVAAFVLLPLAGQAQAPAAGDSSKKFGTEQLDQMLAPIALYPDSLLAQVMMAATYPLEVVEASRWSAANPKLKGDAAVKAVEGKGWDVSVKSLVAFPQLLKQMNDQLEWTQNLGDALLAQQADVAASIQRLRKRALEAGNLKSSEQQKISTQPPPAGSTETQIIVIEAANPQVIYVPVYQTTWVYGPWPYPAYPPYYYPPYPVYGYGAPLLRGFMWGVGIAAAHALFCDWHWGRGGDIDIDITRVVHIDRDYRRAGDGNSWRHQPEHRKGVSYRDSATAGRFGRGPAPGADTRQLYRGKDITRPVGNSGPAPQFGQQGGAFQGLDRGGPQVTREGARGQASGRSWGGGGGRR